MNRLLLLPVLLLSARATSTPIRRYSESKSAFNPGPVLMSHSQPDSNIYRVYQRASTGFTSIDSLREDVEERAEKFCERQGLSMIVLGEKTSNPRTSLGTSPESRSSSRLHQRLGKLL